MLTHISEAANRTSFIITLLLACAQLVASVSVASVGQVLDAETVAIAVDVDDAPTTAQFADGDTATPTHLFPVANTAPALINAAMASCRGRLPWISSLRDDWPEAKSCATVSGMHRSMSMSVSSINTWTARVGRGLH